MSRVWDESLNPYEVLDIENGVDATEDEIKKAYRKLARLKHPDKNPDTKLEEFYLIQSAYEILTDAAARAAYDTVLRGRQLHEERWKKQSEKRRRMREDLEAKERAWTEERRSEATAQAALHRELERLRKKLEREHQLRQQSSRPESKHTSRDLSSMIKLKWTDKEPWSEEKLKGVLETWVDVQTVAIRSTKAPSYSAVVELSCAADVEALMRRQEAAIDGAVADSTPAVVALLKLKLQPLGAEVPTQPTRTQRFEPAPLSEADVLAKMRNAASATKSRT